MLNPIISNTFSSNNKYIKRYLSIIEKALSENRVLHKKNHTEYTYYEGHHILPKSLYPEYKSFKEHSWNKVLLTPKEHFICHLLILKHFKEEKNLRAERKMSRAVFKMNLEGKYNSKAYSKFKLNLTCSEETKAKLRNLYIGKTLEEIHGQEKAAEIRLKIKQNTPKSKQAWSQERRAKYSTKELKNSCAIQVNIYNERDELMFQTHGDFKEVCEDNNLPFTPLYNSYHANGKRLFKTNQSKASLKDKSLLKYEGWYAIKFVTA